MWRFLFLRMTKLLINTLNHAILPIESITEGEKGLVFLLISHSPPNLPNSFSLLIAMAQGHFL